MSVRTWRVVIICCKHYWPLTWSPISGEGCEWNEWFIYSMVLIRMPGQVLDGTDKIADGRMKKQAQKQDGDSDRPDYFCCWGYYACHAWIKWGNEGGYGSTEEPRQFNIPISHQRINASPKHQVTSFLLTSILLWFPNPRTVSVGMSLTFDKW